MSLHVALELLRAYAEGVLPAPAARELERALEQEGPASCEAATYLLVHRVSAPLLAPMPPSRLRFEDLPLAARPPRWVLLSAAAAVLLVGLGTWLLLRGESAARTPQHVRLAHVPWTSEVPAPDALLVAGYRPTTQGHVAWLEDPSAAATLARAAGRPVFSFVQHPDCPLCRALEAGPLRDAAVLRAFDVVVPLRVDVERLPKAQIEALMREGWPHMSVRGMRGEVLGSVAGMPRASELLAMLRSALAAGALPAPAEWSALTAAAEAQARQRQAHLALRASHDLAPRDPAGARERLRAGRAALGATPEGDDLDRVLAAWTPPDPFPLLEETPR